MIYTGKDVETGEFGVTLYAGKFPTQGNKLVIRKGTTKISIPAYDIADFIAAICDTASESGLLKSSAD
jgi:hypothetical protein